MNTTSKIKGFMATHYESQAIQFITQQTPAKYFADECCVLIDDMQDARNLKESNAYHLVVCSPILNNFTNINESLRKIHDSLRWHGIFIGRTETLAHRKQRIGCSYNKIFRKIIDIYEFIFKRALPKLFGFRYFYREFRILNHHILTKCETLGRLRYCGFEIVDLKYTDNFLYFIVSKDSKPLNEIPQAGLLIKIRKVGLDGRTIYCYKLRTMHAYASYLHDYILKNLKIDNEGKVIDDFRKTGWGMLFRKTWLDEIPQLYNVLKGDISLIGFRPLSQEFLLQYPEDWRKERMKIKPGLIPPYYADCPKSFEGIIESEKKYYRLKVRYPVTTDIFYLIRVLINFMLGRTRTG